jgi:predicted amidophosphoribosyltransferase
MGVEPHEGHTRELVLGLKYGKKRSNARSLADIVVEAVGWDGFTCDVVTWAPTTSRHQQDRGMDHAELIARHVGVLLVLPTKRLLRRVNTVSQTGLDRDERLISPEFVARPLGRHRNVLIIDDVVTTGATFRAATRALVEVGALSVVCVAPSRTV